MKKVFCLLVAIFFFIACGGGSNATSNGGGNSGPGSTPTKATSITGTLSTSDALGSGGDVKVVIKDRRVGGETLLTITSTSTGANNGSFSGIMQVKIDCIGIQVELSKAGYKTATYLAPITPGSPVIMSGLMITKI